jgi:hypothetical protein
MSTRPNSTFPDLSAEPSKILEIIANEYIDNFKNNTAKKFDRLGLINGDDIAMVLAAKINEKNSSARIQGKTSSNSIFVIKLEDRDRLIEQIEKLITLNTNEASIKFQIIYYESTHTVFGEFQIDKTTIPPTVRYLHCDPWPPITNCKEIITPKFREIISTKANIEIYDSNAKLQKGKGCSYFSIDGARMLATSPDRDYACNVMEHIKTNGIERKGLFLENNIKYIQSDTLPTRFIRGSHIIEDWNVGNVHIKGLDTTVFNTSEKSTIVNKKGETAEKSINRNIEYKDQRSKSNPEVMESKRFNKRAEHKMVKCKESVLDFMKDKDIFDKELSDSIDRCTINGLAQFCEEKIKNQNDVKR